MPRGARHGCIRAQQRLGRLTGRGIGAILPSQARAGAGGGGRTGEARAPGRGRLDTGRWQAVIVAGGDLRQNLSHLNMGLGRGSPSTGWGRGQGLQCDRLFGTKLSPVLAKARLVRAES